MNTIDGLLNIASWINLYIMGGFTLSISVILAMVFHRESIKFSDFEFPLKHFPLAMLVLTFVHLFLTLKLIKKVPEINASTQKTGVGAWENLINSKYFIFNGMEPRVWVEDGGIFGGGGYETASLDYAFLATFIFSVTLIVATFMSLGLWEKLKRKTPYIIFSRLSISCFLASFNWIIGSQWTIAVSKLASNT